jgi:hypothetical protein
MVPGAERIGDGQDPLAEKDRGHNAIDEVRGEVGHATADAARAEAASLA